MAAHFLPSRQSTTLVPGEDDRKFQGLNLDPVGGIEIFPWQARRIYPQKVIVNHKKIPFLTC